MSDHALRVTGLPPVVVGVVGGHDSPALAVAVTGVEAARKAKVPVVFVRVAFQPGYRRSNSANNNMAPLANHSDVSVETEPTARTPTPMLTGCC